MKYALWILALALILASGWFLLRPKVGLAPTERPGDTAATSTAIAGDYRCGDGTEFSLAATSSGYVLLPATSVEHVPRTTLYAAGQGAFEGYGVTVEPIQGGLAVRAPRVDTTCQKIGQNTSAFSAEGTVVKDNPGLRPGVWYLVYERPGAPALSVELDLNAVDVPYIDLRQGERVHVEGTLRGSVVTVTTITEVQ